MSDRLDPQLERSAEVGVEVVAPQVKLGGEPVLPPTVVEVVPTEYKLAPPNDTAARPEVPKRIVEGKSDGPPEPLRELAADIAREAAEQRGRQQTETEKRQAIKAMDDSAQKAYHFANIKNADWPAWECLIVAFVEASKAAGCMSALDEAIEHFGRSANKAERYAAALARLATEHTDAGHVAKAFSLASDQGFLPAVRDAIEGICGRATAPRRGFAKRAASQGARLPTVDEFVAASESLENVMGWAVGAPIIANGSETSPDDRNRKEILRKSLLVAEQWMECSAGIIDSAESVLVELRDGPDAVFRLGSDAYTSAHAAARFVVQDFYTGSWGWLECEGSPLEFPLRRIDLQQIEARWDALLLFLNGFFLRGEKRRDAETLRAILRKERIEVLKRLNAKEAQSNNGEATAQTPAELPQPPATEATERRPGTEAGEKRDSNNSASEQGEGDGQSRGEILKSLQPAWRQAYLAFELSQTINGKQLEDQEAFDYIYENGFPDNSDDLGELDGYKLPDSFDTWARYLRATRQALGEQKYNKRAGRATGRSIAKASELDQLP